MNAMQLILQQIEQNNEMSKQYKKSIETAEARIVECTKAAQDIDRANEALQADFELLRRSKKEV